MKKRGSSRRWLDRHVNDEFVKQAQRDGYRSRAAYKLMEINERDKLIQPGMVIVDLGAAPGGWCQVARKLMGKTGRVVGLDILEMEPIEMVEFIQGDFTRSGVLERLSERLDGRKVDLVLSDMAPNVTGVSSVDQPRAMYLCELALDFARNQLVPGGSMMLKVFQGEGFDPFVRDMREAFTSMVTRKPKASRQQSREVYLLGRHLR